MRQPADQRSAPAPGAPAPGAPGPGAPAPGAPGPGAPARPVLPGDQVVIRPGQPQDVAALQAILAEPGVAAWWGDPEPAAETEAKLLGGGPGEALLVIESNGQVAGGIEYSEENEPMYRHAGIDIYLSRRFSGRGLGTEAVTLLAAFLMRERGHHRLTIDPAAGNRPAIRCYEKAGFRRVGIMREYERGRDGRFHDGPLMDLVRSDIALEPDDSGPDDPGPDAPGADDPGPDPSGGSAGCG